MTRIRCAPGETSIGPEPHGCRPSSPPSTTSAMVPVTRVLTVSPSISTVGPKPQASPVVESASAVYRRSSRPLIRSSETPHALGGTGVRQHPDPQAVRAHRLHHTRVGSAGGHELQVTVAGHRVDDERRRQTSGRAGCQRRQDLTDRALVPPRQLEAGRRSSGEAYQLVSRGPSNAFAAATAGSPANVEVALSRTNRRESGAKSSSSAGPFVATARPASRHSTGAPTSTVRSNPVSPASPAAWRLLAHETAVAVGDAGAPRRLARPDRRSSRRRPCPGRGAPRRISCPAMSKSTSRTWLLSPCASSTVIRTVVVTPSGSSMSVRAPVLADRHASIEPASVRQPHLRDVGPLARVEQQAHPPGQHRARRTSPRSTDPPAGERRRRPRGEAPSRRRRRTGAARDAPDRGCRRTRPSWRR